MTIDITPERVSWFEDYHFEHPAWGVFHVSLEDRNWEYGAFTVGRELWPADVREAAEWFDGLSPSQRRELKRMCEE